MVALVQSAARIHIFKLQRFQYSCIRIALGCMTHTMSLKVLAGVPPLSDHFVELTLRLFIRCEVSHSLVIENLRLIERNSKTRCMSLYYLYMILEVNPSSIVSNRSCFPSLIQ